MERVQATIDTNALTLRIAFLIGAGRHTVARPLLAAVRRVAAPSPRLSELAAQIAQLDGRPDLALQELNEAVARDPDHPSLRKCRAAVRIQMDDREGAAADAAEAVILDNEDPAAKAAL